MTDQPRRPAAFRLDDPGVVVATPDAEVRAIRGVVRVTP